MHTYVQCLSKYSTTLLLRSDLSLDLSSYFPLYFPLMVMHLERFLLE